MLICVILVRPVFEKSYQLDCMCLTSDISKKHSPTTQLLILWLLQYLFEKQKYLYIARDHSLLKRNIFAYFKNMLHWLMVRDKNTAWNENLRS